LFLFENASDLLKALLAALKKQHAHLLLIIPNTEGKNFKWFQSAYGGQNKFIIEENSIRTFFTGMRFKVKDVLPLAFTHHFNRSDVRLFSRRWVFYLNFLNRFQSKFKIGKPNYFLVALSS
jgi:hypothetical protein